MNFIYRFALAGIFIFCSLISFSNNPQYEQRRTGYVNAMLLSSGDAITIQAYKGVAIDTNLLKAAVGEVTTIDVSDFTIVKLIRVLYFSNGQYDSIILPVLNQMPYWLRKDEKKKVYWSENHMCMWMSSEWLLHEKYGKPIDSTLDTRLRHYLKIKNQYGYYEFFSSVYLPYTLSGLLNLADFAQDPEIKSLATTAAQRLLKDILRLTNDKGTYFPCAGRNYYGKYKTPYNQNHNNLIYLLTGMGPMPAYASHAGGFLSTSTLEVDSVINSWTPTLDTTYQIAHSFDSLQIVHSVLAQIDKVMFQWSAGAYFHPATALESAQLLTDSNIWAHNEFKPFAFFSSLPPPSILSLSTQLSYMSRSTVNTGAVVRLYKHNSITLSSLHDFWKGNLGYQQIPCVANVGTTAVLLATGEVMKDWEARKETNDNDDLPYVEQHKNIALLMYRAEPKLANLGYAHKQIALHWRNEDFDEIVEDSAWLIGRQQNGYVAVRRYCIGTIDSVRACYIDKGHSWVMVVGDSSLYGGFGNFKNIIHQSQFEDRWYFDSINRKSVYYAKTIVDTTTIEYAWGIDTLSTGIEDMFAESLLAVYPNPANDRLNISTAAGNTAIKLAITNSVGQLLYTKEDINNTTEAIDISAYAKGLYWVTAEINGQLYTRKFIKAD